jgi:uncharacterized protein
LQPFCKKVNKIISKFDINIHGLEDKTYEYQFEGSDSFFEAFEQDFLNNGIFKTSVVVEKNPTMIRMTFKISAQVRLECDRCLEEFVESFDFEEKYIYKLGEKAQIVTDEMEILPFSSATINVATHIFDFIALKIPMKKLHPKFRAVEYDNEDGIMVYSDTTGFNSEEEKENQIDPRWADLLKLKNFKK